MDVSRDSTWSVLYGGRSLLTPSFFLMRWTNKDTGIATYCICTNIGNDEGPILLQVTETGAVTPDPFSAEVQLASVNYQLETWEQTSSTNLFPPDEDPEFSELINVEDADIPTPPPVDPCSGCPGVVCDDATVENSTDTYHVSVASGDTLILPDVTNTDSDGSPVVWPAQTPFVCTPAITAPPDYYYAIAIGHP